MPARRYICRTDAPPLRTVQVEEGGEGDPFGSHVHEPTLTSVPLPLSMLSTCGLPDAEPPSTSLWSPLRTSILMGSRLLGRATRTRGGGQGKQGKQGTVQPTAVTAANTAEPVSPVSPVYPLNSQSWPLPRGRPLLCLLLFFFSFSFCYCFYSSSSRHLAHIGPSADHQCHLPPGCALSLCLYPLVMKKHA